MSFVFPPSQEHPEALGRLELFARYGPTDEEGRLRGGIGGHHIHTDNEIRQMIRYMSSEALFAMYKRPRDQAEVLVDGVLPVALEENITKSEIRRLLQTVPRDADSRMTFAVLQDIVAANQQSRLKAVMKDYSLRAKKDGAGAGKVPYQNKQADALLAITRRKKLNIPEENFTQGKRLHAFSQSLALIQDCQTKADQIVLNVAICRPRGDVDDRWDRYCAVRRTGRSGYVQARNQPRAHLGLDGLDKHPGANSLTATMA